MDVPTAVHVLDCSEQLQQKAFDFGLRKGVFDHGHHCLKIVIKELHDHVDFVHLRADDHLSHGHNVDVVEREKHVRLAKRRDRKSLFCSITAHLNLLERDDRSAQFASCAKHNAVCALVDAVQSLVILNAAAAVHERVVLSTELKRHGAVPASAPDPVPDLSLGPNSD